MTWLAEAADSHLRGRGDVTSPHNHNHKVRRPTSASRAGSRVQTTVAGGLDPIMPVCHHAATHRSLCCC
eukprot:5498248-Prymnesium_polylepis.1